MIDEEVRPELEALLRATFDEMIPKVVRARVSPESPEVEDASFTFIGGRDRPNRSIRRLVVSGLVVAAVVAGLIGVVSRDTDDDNALLDSASSTGSATAPTSTFVSSDTIGPIDDGSLYQPTTYYPTASPMPIWPEVATSGGTPIGHSDYGLALCSVGSWTKYASLASTTRMEELYEGTLCTFTTFNHPISETVASCSSMSEGINYARCQERFDTTSDPPSGQPDGTGPVSVERSDGVGLLPATAALEPQIFGDGLSVLANRSGPAYADDAVSIVLRPGDSPEQTCFEIQRDVGTSAGCVDSLLLKTGLAYGAFQSQGGPIDIVGIVPDDVGSVEIGGEVRPITNNVWHYRGQAGQDLSFTVRSIDSKITASVS
jgi:hypothetical protein